MQHSQNRNRVCKHSGAVKRIVVIGGGPAGMMAAIRAAQAGSKVTLLEQNSTLGKKLLLSGKGRCNLTNNCPLELFLQRFPAHNQFLRDAFKSFFNRQLMDFFQSRGLALKVERQERVFPVTDESSSILEVLQNELARLGVTVMCEVAVRDIVLEKGSVKGVRLKEGRSIPAERVVLATGGVSYPFTGSRGQGHAIAVRIGHTVTPLRAGLVPLETVQDYPARLEGLTLKNIRVKIIEGKRQILSEIGELLFTSFGVSGPLVLTLSGRVVDSLAGGVPVAMEIDLKPALSTEQLHTRLLREFAQNPRKSLRNIFKEFLPQRLVDIFIEIAKMKVSQKVSYVTQKERQELVRLLKSFRVDIRKARPIEEGMVTCGGVSLKEINPRTMESRLIKGLFFAGEIIDVHADTGGFNLQAAFSTGYLAGESAAVN